MSAPLQAGSVIADHTTTGGSTYLLTPNHPIRENQNYKPPT